MVEKVMVAVPAAFPAGEIVAGEVSAEGYMDKYAAEFHEWVKGVLHYLIMLLEACFELNPIGRVLSQPFVMEIEAADSKREPDLQVILNSNPGTLTPTKMEGPTDLCAGVQDYWIIDPNRTSCMCRLSGRMNCPKQARSRRPSKMFAEDAV